MDDPTTSAAMEAPPQQQPQGLQVILPLEEFAEDLDMRLGRANGNIFHRRPGVDGVHDGQVMVRLKKKRFIVIDYAIEPHDEDVRAASVAPHISCPPGAGKQKCATPECTKVGVPVLLYDSDPAEPPSLYLRSGLCFTCQRNLNEKRRTQRKRGSTSSTASNQGGGRGGNSSSLNGIGNMMVTSDDHNLLYAMGPGTKRFKLGNGNVIELHQEAIILNKPPIDEEGKTVYTHRDGYGFPEIGVDLQSMVSKAANDTDKLIHAVSSATTTSMTGETNTTVGAGQSSAAAEEAATNAAVDAALSAAGAATTSTTPTATVDPTGGGSGDDITLLYDKAMSSLSKSVYLLTQWKQSWDGAIAAAVAQETAVVGGDALAEAVASAAAVAAVAGDDGTSSNMTSLLIAADQRKGVVKPDPSVETFAV